MTIHLPPELERALAERAEAQGTTPELLALDALRERYLPPVEPASEEHEGTLADFLAGYVGVLHSSELTPGGARMSEGGGKAFVEGLHRKRRSGRL
jgi:predicted transcriptional regulator